MEARPVPVLGDTLFAEEIRGLRAMYLYKPGWTKAYATIATRYGSLDSAWRADGQEIRVPDGIAHFLEHKLFEQEDGSVADRFSALGASANAYTNYTSTTYLFSATDRVEESLALLLTFVQKAYFTPESVAKEQGIIEQELRMYEDDPGWRVWHNLLGALYHAHPVRIDIGGTPESIRAITPDLLYLCHRTFYHPSNMLFFAVGALPPERVFDIVAHHVADAPPPPRIERIRPAEPDAVVRAEAVAEMPVGVPLVELGFKVPTGRLSLREEIAAGLALEAAIGRSSPLYTELYEEGLITERFGGHIFKGEDYAAIVVGGESRDPKTLVDHLRTAFERIRREGLPAEDVERAKRAEIGEFIGLFNSPEAVAHAFNDLYFKGEDLLEYLPTLSSIAMEDVARATALLDPERAAASLVVPKAG